MNTREEMIKHLKHGTDVLRDELIEHAFREVDRADFVTDDYKVEAYEDYALPTMNEQTISQPTVVAFMLEKLGVEPGASVLDVGSGSGYTTALLAEIAGNEGDVLGIEIVPELVEFGRKNLSKYEYPWARIEGASVDVPEDHFDKVLVSATMSFVPENIMRALKDGGRIVTPIDGALAVYEKDGNALSEKEFFSDSVVFVPYIHAIE